MAATSLPAPKYFNPRSPCGERHGDWDVLSCFGLFQSALPLRGATLSRLHAYGNQRISIRAPLAGSDERGRFFHAEICNFNPRSPCGERQLYGRRNARPRQFQSALPLRGATIQPKGPQGQAGFQSALPLRGATSFAFLDRDAKGFQSALPLRGATRRKTGNTRWIRYFNPRSPCGERLALILCNTCDMEISIRAPLAGSDVELERLSRGNGISIRAPLAGSDRQRCP